MRSVKMEEVKVKFEIPMDFDMAFSALCQVLDMEWINDDANFEIKNGYVYKNGKKFDCRANMFAALRNVLNATYGNLEFRGDSYITHYSDDE